MGAVHEAIDLRLHHTVAVKRMTAEGAGATRAFEREGQLLASLRHAGLPSVTDYFAEGDGRFLVMQYIEGEDLEQIRRRHGGVCARADVLGWAADLLDIVAFLHRHDPPVVHRDIKPANIKLTPKGDIVLVDFGLAKSAHLETTHLGDVGEPRSVYGFTPSYAPPEQLAGTGTDARSDLYAIGATLYHLLTGVMPAAANQRLVAIANGAPDPLQPAHLVHRGVGAALSAIVTRAMSLSVHDRFQTAEELRSALAALPSLDHQEARGREVSDERRVDAAMPSEAQLGTTVDLIVQVRFAASPPLGLEDWPGKHAPDSIEQASEAVRVTYPTDPSSGRELPARLRIKIVAPDFTVNGTADCLIEVPPAQYSKRLTVLLTPLREGVCRAHVEIYASDSLHLGTLLLEITAHPSASATQELRVAQLVLRMVTRELPKPEARPMVASRTGIAVAQASQLSTRPSEEPDTGSHAPISDTDPAPAPPLRTGRVSRWAAVGAPLAVVAIGAVVMWQTGPMPTQVTEIVPAGPPTNETRAAPPADLTPPVPMAPTEPGAAPPPPRGDIPAASQPPEPPAAAERRPSGPRGSVTESKVEERLLENRSADRLADPLPTSPKPATNDVMPRPNESSQDFLQRNRNAQQDYALATRLYNVGDYLTATRVFGDLAKREPGWRDVATYLERAGQALDKERQQAIADGLRYEGAGHKSYLAKNLSQAATELTAARDAFERGGRLQAANADKLLADNLERRRLVAKASLNLAYTNANQRNTAEAVKWLQLVINLLPAGDSIRVQSESALAKIAPR